MKNEMSSTMPMELTPNCDISFTYCFRNMRTAQTEKVPPFTQIHRADELRFKAVRKHAPRILGLCAAVQHFEIRRFRLLHGAFPNIKEL